MGLLGDIIGLVIDSVIMPYWFDRFTYGNERNRHSAPEWYKLIYPKWLKLKQSISYRIMTKKAYRHIQQENKRLIIGVMIRN